MASSPAASEASRPRRLAPRGDPKDPEDGLAEYFAGRKLYGDDFDARRIQEWFDDEKESYAALASEARWTHGYPFHALNARLGFRRLPRQTFARVLGFGSADGEEFVPILPAMRGLDVVEASDTFVRRHVHGVPVTYTKPSADGSLPFADGLFDLITCFGVLHHIPNVRKVVGEMHRCLRPGGHALLREPIRSMGDWRRPRPGLTKRERGIPLGLFRNLVRTVGFDVVHEALCLSPFLGVLERILHWPAYSAPSLLAVDGVLCSLLSRNTRYHPRTLLERLGPTSVFFVLRKPAGGSAVVRI